MREMEYKAHATLQERADLREAFAKAEVEKYANAKFIEFTDPVFGVKASDIRIEFQSALDEIARLREALEKIIKAQENCDHCYNSSKDVAAANRGYDRTIKLGKQALSANQGESQLKPKQGE